MIAATLSLHYALYAMPTSILGVWLEDVGVMLVLQYILRSLGCYSLQELDVLYRKPSPYSRNNIHYPE